MESISFKGVSNSLAMTIGKQSPQCFRLSTKLNNLETKDLTEFSDILKKFKSPQQDIIQIDRSWTIKGENADLAKQIMVNGKRLLANDTNIPIFQKITKLTRKITNKEIPIQTESNFIEQASQELVDKKIFESPKIAKAYIKNVSDPERVRNVAKTLNSDVQEIMKDYFDTVV